MKTIANLITALILTSWIVTIAILSVQNYTLVSLKFLNVESVKIPIGILLAFSVGVGIMAGAIVPLFWQFGGYEQPDLYEDEEY